VWIIGPKEANTQKEKTTSGGKAGSKVRVVGEKGATKWRRCERLGPGENVESSAGVKGETRTAGDQKRSEALHRNRPEGDGPKNGGGKHSRNTVRSGRGLLTE